MRDLDEAAWAEVRRLYETSDLSVHKIITRFGITNRQLYRRCAADGWHMRAVSPLEVMAAAQLRRGSAQDRAAVSKDKAAISKAPPPTARDGLGGDPAVTGEEWHAAAAGKRRPARKRNRGGAPCGRTGREELLSRIVRLAERNLAIMEQHMETEDGHLTAEERERSTRTVGTLVRTLEKVTELNSGNDDASATADIDRAAATAELRRELAQRLYRMWGKPKR